MVLWTNQMQGFYMSWAKEPESCYNPTSGAPRDCLSLLHTWSAAVQSQVMPKLSILLLLVLRDGHVELHLQSFADFWLLLCELEHSFGKWNCFFFLSLPLGDQEGRLDLSHPVHVDNCLLEPETKQCWREPPAFIHRDLRYTKSRENTTAKKKNVFMWCCKLCQEN